MMAPIHEEIGQTVREGVSLFKSAPVVFAAMMFNIIFLVTIARIAREGGLRWQAISEKILATCSPHI